VQQAATCGNGAGPVLATAPLFLPLDRSVAHHTKILDSIRATFLPRSFLQTKIAGLPYNITMTIPDLLMIATPGHAPFANLRSRRPSICNVAILAVHIFSGLEKQTEESLCLLEQRATPFIVGLNKIDRLTRWAAQPGLPTRARHESLRGTTKHHFDEH
jgi:translation initiation factor IF-2